MKNVKFRVPSSSDTNTIYCGLDVHKETTYATIINVFGEGQTQKRMKNEEIPDFLEPYQVEKVAMEASTYIMPLYRELSEEGYDITEAQGKDQGRDGLLGDQATRGVRPLHQEGSRVARRAGKRVHRLLPPAYEALQAGDPGAEQGAPVSSER
jgi:hypothetical protein